MANRYWVGGSGTWDNTNTAPWSASSGGTGGQSVPTSSDDVYFDGNSGGGTVIPTATLPAVAGVYCRNINFTGWSGTLYNNLGDNYNTIFNIYGNMTLSPTMTMSGTGVGDFIMRAGGTITTNNISSLGPTDWNIAPLTSPTVTINGDFNTSGCVLFQSGVTVNVNNNITAGGFIFYNVATMNMGTGTWTVTGYDGQYSASYKAFDVRTLTTLNPSSSTIKFTNNSSSAKSFVGLNKTYNNIWVNTGSSGIFYFYNSNTFNDLKIDAGRTVYFSDASDQTVTTLTAIGSYSSKITMRGTGTLGWKISDTSGTNNCEWLDIDYSTAEGGATFNSIGYVDGGHNSGWNFSAVAPILTTTSITVTGQTTMTGVANVVNDGGSTILERGFCYSSTNSTPTIVDSIMTSAGATGSYDTYIINLDFGKKYYLRAYATNSIGTTYSSIVYSRTTDSGTISVSDLIQVSEIASTYPAIAMRVNTYDLLSITENKTIHVSLIMNTTAVSGIGVLTATANGNILSIGSSNATIRGAVWSTSSYPDPGNIAPTLSSYGGHNETSGSYGTGAYTTPMSGLISSTDYYVRSYGYNPAGYKYGSEVTFKTGGFSNPANIYTDNGSYTTFAATSGDLTVELSKDGGLNWQNALIKTFGAGNTTEVYGIGANELWGSSWTVDDMTNTNFRVRLSQGDIKQVYNGFGFGTSTETLTGIEVAVKGHYSSSTLSLDVLKVKIYYGTSILPVQEGSMVFCSNGRKAGESAGNGTGLIVYYAKTDLIGGYGWIASDTGIEVAA